MKPDRLARAKKKRRREFRRLVLTVIGGGQPSDHPGPFQAETLSGDFGGHTNRRSGERSLMAVPPKGLRTAVAGQARRVIMVSIGRISSSGPALVKRRTHPVPRTLRQA